MRKIILITAVLLAIALGYYYVRHPLGEKALINGHTVRLELAVTDTEREKGLGDRDSLAADSGMLFVYQNKDRYGFWMKGMRFPLDFVWIDGNRIVDLSENIPAPATPGDRPYELSPHAPVDKVLEVNAGVIQKLGIRIGNTIVFTN